MLLKERTPEARAAYLQGYEAGRRDEREACLKIADAIAADVPQDERHGEYVSGAAAVACAIRAGGAPRPFNPMFDN